MSNIIIPRGPSERSITRRTDAYKISHHLFYEPGIKWMYDYMESRGGEFGDITPFGAQALCQKEFTGPRVTVKQVERDRKFYKAFFGFDGVYDYDAWMFIAKELDGILPLEVWALPEGLNVPVRTPIVTYFNTHKVMDHIINGQRKIIKEFGPKVSMLPGFIEPTMFHVWAPTTISTYSQHIKKVLYQALQETGTPENIRYMLCDFGLRGVSSFESAEAGGAAHLVHFSTSDNIPSIAYINEFYGDGKFDEDGDPTYLPCMGVCATEHSVMTHKGLDHEADVVEGIFAKCPTGLVSIVGDSKNLWDFATEILGTRFHDTIINRDGVTIGRPDSGEPIPTMLKFLWLLGEKFGTHLNSKGYKMLGLPEHRGKIKALQGEKNTYDAIYNMGRALKGAGWSIDNIATFGQGGALLQGHTRDELNMAVKLSSLEDADGNEREVYKDPVTDPGKYSKRGRFAVLRKENPVTGESKITWEQLKPGEENREGNLLRPILRNGEMLHTDTFEEIRERADEWMKTA